MAARIPVLVYLRRLITTRQFPEWQQLKGVCFLVTSKIIIKAASAETWHLAEKDGATEATLTNKGL
jgi:hypothetical protein